MTLLELRDACNALLEQSPENAEERIFAPTAQEIDPYHWVAGIGWSQHSRNIELGFTSEEEV